MHHAHGPHGHAHGPHGHAHGPHGHAHGAGEETSEAARYAFHAIPGSTVRPQLERGAGRGRILFFDCPSGISGDMTLAALLDLGVPRAVFDEAIEALGLAAEAKLLVDQGQAGVLRATRVQVTVLAQPPERTHAAVRALIEGGKLSPAVRERALAVFERLAVAEAEVHGVPPSEVTFHEVGATDSIIDVVCAVAGLEYLGAELIVSPLPLGRGFAETQHGRLPLPAPATLLCLRGIPTVPDPLPVELVTPTGAALVAVLAKTVATWPALVPEDVGWGAGTMTLPDRPNALRAVLGESAGKGEHPGAVSDAASLGEHGSDHVVLFEANIDDMTGEALGYALGRLLEAGAVDAWITPIVMKKGRPAFLLSALAARECASRVEQTFFDETSTLGVRRRETQRTTLTRAIVQVPTRFGIVPVKERGSPPDHYKPEFDVCVALAEQHRVPVRVVIEEALAQVRSRR